jgi:hypothetical protein
MKSDYQYSAQIVYNNFPWPDQPTDTQKQKIEDTAQAVLDARATFPDSSLADLYDPLTMPPALVKTHQKLDAAADAAYGKRPSKTTPNGSRFCSRFISSTRAFYPLKRQPRSREDHVLRKLESSTSLYKLSYRTLAPASLSEHKCSETPTNARDSPAAVSN